MQTSILITGATGTVGRHLVAALQARADDATRLVTASTRGEAVDGLPGRALDLLDARSAREAFAGMERVFLPTPAHPAMEAMTAHAVEAAVAAGVRHLVRLSGAGADVDSDVALARLQGRCDRHVIDSGLDYTLLRPKNFMQNFIRYQGAMIRAGAVYSPLGDGRVPYVDARDLAAAAAVVLRDPAPHAGRAYTLTGPEALTDTEALATIAAATGRPVERVSISASQAEQAMREAGMPEPMVEAMSSLNRAIAAGRVAEVTDELPQLLCRPATRWADFVREHRAAWQ
ncbi:MAG: hypothetical protein B7X39_16365 [Lysobacterales bacterium 14-68-21]|jgi:uncharacterized protein YbjT (DUF2867 family)|nr:MAG: hypothetical protein B7X45_14355 [Xanthomonadales bacterium 15-68-25]OZB64379.1 MAG: hypothetical protein B7X39_16365 [Xanthomonadales bacterium 14-68-21]